MKGIRIYEHGGLDKLIYEDIPNPECKSGEIKVQIKATSINHLDLWVRSGIPGTQISLPIIPGSDGAGTIIYIDNKVDNLKDDCFFLRCWGFWGPSPM